MEHRVRPTDEGVYIEINDPTEGWMPIFGANSRGDFVGMPTCHPFDDRSNPKGDGHLSIMLCIELLTNFSPFKGDTKKHPWMGMDRYQTAEKCSQKPRMILV